MIKRDESNPELSQKDTFLTARNSVLWKIKFGTKGMVKLLLEHGFNVYRYKIESTICDSKFEDLLELVAKGLVCEKLT